MKLVIAVTLCFVFSEANTVSEKWQYFKLYHGKSYKSELDERRRFEVFQENLQIIEQHNEKFLRNEILFRMGVTQFADLRREEFKSLLVYARPKNMELKAEVFEIKGVGVNFTIDYVKSGLVTDVKNQGQIGDSSAFGVVGVVEGQVAKKKKILKSLSVQNLIDCASGNNYGSGGVISYYKYIKENGILNEDEYPNSNDHQCHKKGGWKISNYYEVPKNSTDATLEALATVGPLAMTLDATDLQFYASGVIGKGGSCQNNLNHVALIVGAATEKDVDYFLVKNSWGKNWGENGYFRIKRDGNICGSLLYNTYAKL